MIIKKIAIGNLSEAFIEDRLSDRVNVIFSDDNNKGKTILMQGLMYSIGYQSIFPKGFDCRKYYFYTKIKLQGVDHEFLRQKNTIIVKKDNQILLFESISEFKNSFAKNVMNVPVILKEGRSVTADLSLFYELFFLGQDKRNTSNIIVRTNFNKNDFINMILVYQGMPSDNHLTDENLHELIDKKNKLENRIKIDRKKISILKKNPNIAKNVSQLADRENFEIIKNRLKELNGLISDLQKERNREENRKEKLRYLIEELNSLNRDMKEGKVICATCQSVNIIYRNNDFEFDVSNENVRNNVLASIRENILIKEEIIEEKNYEIKNIQIEIGQLLDNPAPDFIDYVLYEDEIRNSREMDVSVMQLKIELDEIQSQIKAISNSYRIAKDKREELLSDITQELMRIYKLIDPEGAMKVDGLFTKSSENFSGSEEQEFYICKILALNNILKHDYPILIDSFREGELSTDKEEKVLNQFMELDKQVIITSTLKREEYSNDKYTQFFDINALDYSQIEDSQLLQAKYVAEFKKLVESFSLNLKQF